MAMIPSVAFEPTDLEHVADPYPILAELRAAGSLVRTPSGFVAAVGHAAATDVLRSPVATSGLIGLRYQAALPPGAARDEMSHRINFLDPPDHPRVRGLVSKAFTPRRIAALRPFAQHATTTILDALARRGSRFDLLHDVAHQVPSLVISELLGVPGADRERLTGWSDAVTPLLGVQVDPHEGEVAIVAAEEMHAYLGDLLERRRAAPADDLLSGLLAAEEDGERLSRVELLSLAATLYSAGHRTTRDLTTNGVSVLLGGDATGWQAVRAGRWPIADVVQEMLRHETPTLFVARVPAAALVADGTEIDAGTPVLVYLAAANRDPGVYEEPDRFDPGRWADGPAAPPTPLSFAFGSHFCLGASLARMEAEVMVGALAERFAHLSADPDAPRPSWRQRGPFRSLTSLPVVAG